MKEGIWDVVKDAVFGKQALLNHRDTMRRIKDWMIKYTYDQPLNEGKILKSWFSKSRCLMCHRHRIL